MSLLGQSRHIQRTPKTNFVRYAPNSDHSMAEFVCRLSANRDRCTAANCIVVRSHRWRDGTQRETASRRPLQNPIRCFDQAAAIAAEFLFVQAYSVGHDEASAGPYLATTLEQRVGMSHSIWKKDALYTLAIPAMSMSADALVRVEKARTEAVPIPMISGLAQPEATGIGFGGQQGSGQQECHEGCEHTKLTHVSYP
jgi:hypothetical protein